MKVLKRSISMLMALVMTLSLLPQMTHNTFAAEPTKSVSEITLGDFAVAKVGKTALSKSDVLLSQKSLIAVPYPGAALLVSVNRGYQVRIHSGDNNNNINQVSEWLTDGETYTLPAASIYMRVSIQREDGSAISLEDLEAANVSVSYESSSNILEDNEDTAQILKNSDLPVLIHLSDIHGDTIRADRAASFADFVGADALLASGDLTAYEPDDWGSALFDTVEKYPSVNFLYGIGNHDAKISANNYHETIYNSYFKDNPSAADGETYYFRDLPRQKLRLISVNQQEGAATTSNGGTCYSQAQVDWLVETLKSTPAGYGVILMYHSPEVAITNAAAPDYSEFFQNGNRYDRPTNSYSGYSGTLLMDLVDAFMLRKDFTWNYSEKDGASPVILHADFTQVADDVEFIAHVTGHVHADSITYLPGTACKQLLLGVTCTTSMYGEDGGYYGLADYSDLNRKADTANQDAFNAYMIDREAKTVRILRVGAQQTSSGHIRDEMTIPYSIPFKAGKYSFDTEGLVKLDLDHVEWVNYGIQPYGTEPTYYPGVRWSPNMIFDVPYEGVTFYIKINAPYEIGIRSGETDTTMDTNYYWLNNRESFSGNKNRGYAYTIPAGHEKFIFSVANIARGADHNIISDKNSISFLELQAAGLEIWYSPEPTEESPYPFGTEDKIKLDLNDAEWVNHGIQAYGPEPTYLPGVRISPNMIFDVPYDHTTFYIKINAPYEVGIRSGETDTTMTTNYYWLNNKFLTDGDNNRGYVYTIPAGHTRLIFSIANITRGITGNISSSRNPISLAELEAAGLEIWYVPAAHTHNYEPTVTTPSCTEQGYTTYACECGDSYVGDYVDATGDHTYENGVCTGCGVNKWDTDGDGVLEILAVGNSFSVDALEYAYQIAQNLGIEEIVIGNLYIGGCSLSTHAANAVGDNAKYVYYYNDSGSWSPSTTVKSPANSKISEALESRSWDYISLQQSSTYSGAESTYNKNLTTLIDYVKERSDAKLVWHMTWAYQQDSTHSAFPSYGSDQMTMYNAIVSAVQNKIVTNENFDLIVPNGTAVQNSRTSILGDTTTRDDHHMSYDYGRYLTGLMFIKTITSLDINGITYAPSDVDADEIAIAVESVNNAYAHPFTITASEYVSDTPKDEPEQVPEEVPEEGYILLRTPMYQGAFWHPMKDGRYNELIDDQHNSYKFFTTVRFTRETLPVGSIIVLENGWQYRPDGWVTDTLQSGSREGVTTKHIVPVTEEWWENYTIRSFNISRPNGASVMDLTEEEMRAIFQIYVPEEKHTHTYSNSICTGCGETIPQPTWEQGTILAASGLEKDYPNVIRTADYLRISDYVGMTLNADHYITYFVYDAEHNYLGNGNVDLTANFLLSGQGISSHEMLIRYPEGEYFRIALWRGKDDVMTPDMLDGAGVNFLDATHDPVFWEMGSIYAASGIAFVREQVIRSVNYLPIEDYAGVTVADGYAVSFLAYDEDLNYLGNGNPAMKGYFIPGGISMKKIVDQYPATKYVRLLLREDPIADITMNAVELSEIRLYKAGETVPEKTYPYLGLDSSFDLEFANGLLDINNGTYHRTDSGFVTTITLPLEHISKITWEKSYGVLWTAYDTRNEYLGSCVSYLNSGEITKADILAVCGEASYIALSVKPASLKDMGIAQMVQESELTIHHDLSHTGSIAHDTIMQAQKSQDGAIYNDTLFLFNAAGKCTVFDIGSKAKLGSFTLDKVNILNPHANSVCFSDVYYEQNDPFPLLYVNIYNNYKTSNDRKEGTCCVYRIFEENGTYSTKLVQVLKIGFTDDYDLWNSAEGNGHHYYLPYGNFIVDTNEDKLWTFVLRNGENQTRFFKFDLPDISEGIYNESYGCNLVTLEASDIEDLFDSEHFEVLQGCTYADGKIYSANGLGTSSSYNPFAELKVIDLRSKSVAAVVDFSTLGFDLEPEMISFNVDGDGQLYYLSIDGTLRRLRFVDAPLNAAPIGVDDHIYENGLCTACGTKAPSFEGKTVSILGDSISTYGGVSNNTSSNSTIGNNAAYYAGAGGITRADTWWQQAIDVLGMDLLVNNSWSGSCVFQPRKGEASVGYTERCVNLHNDHTGEEPDVILVFLGTNDFKSCPDTLGRESDINYDALITDHGDGTYTYAAATSTCEAYAIMLHKISARYPDAEIYCMNLLPRKTGNTQPTAFNADLATIAEKYRCKIIDLQNCGFSTDVASMEKYMYDGGVHPNKEGMDLITQAVVSALTGKETLIRDVGLTLSNVISDSTIHACIDGKPFHAQLTAINPKETISLTVIMDGEDVTAPSWNGSEIFIPCVTGNVTVTATAKRGDLSFRWEFSNGELINVVSDMDAPNTLTKIRGSSENDVFSDTCYRTQHRIELKHNLPWEIIWNGSGSGGFMLSDASSAASSSMYFRRHTQGLLHVFGVYEDGKYKHYGIKPANYGIDASEEHTYHLKNCVTEDASNMIHLFIDGVDLGPMNHYYVGYQDQKITSDWISGKDFFINYVGSSSHPLDCYSMEYLAVWESGHVHSYTTAITPPTCTEQGYTTHTCTVCGDSYVDSHMDALGHSFGDWITTVEPSCTEVGAERRDCDRCEHYETRAVVSMGHREVAVPGKAPTCTETGLTDGKKCAVCEGTILTQEILPATGHTYTFVVEHGELYRRCLCGDSMSACKVVRNGTEVTVTLPHDLCAAQLWVARYTINGQMQEVHSKEVTERETFFTLSSGEGIVKVFFLTSDSRTPWLSAKNN